MSTDENILLAPILMLISWVMGEESGVKPFVELASVLGDTPLSVGLPFSVLSFRNSIEEQALPERSSQLGSAEMEDLW